MNVLVVSILATVMLLVGTIAYIGILEEIEKAKKAEREEFYKYLDSHRYHK